MQLYILDDAGEPVLCEDTVAWGDWYESSTNRLVEEDYIGGVRVRTQFLGMDVGMGEGPPILWESKVFGGPLHGECYRYTNKADAQRWHKGLVARVIALES